MKASIPFWLNNDLCFRSRYRYRFRERRSHDYIDAQLFLYKQPHLRRGLWLSSTSDTIVWAKGATHTSMGQRPMKKQIRSKKRTEGPIYVLPRVTPRHKAYAT